MEKSILHIDNSIFQSNSYCHNTTLYLNGSFRTYPTIGVIVLSPLNPHAIVETRISNTVFQKNTFIINHTHTQFMDENDKVLATGAIINIKPPVGVLELTNTSFIQNEGYSSALVLIGQAPYNSNTSLSLSSQESLISFSENKFLNNTPNQLHENGLSCVLLYEYGDKSSNLNDSCTDYNYDGGVK